MLWTLSLSSLLTIARYAVLFASVAALAVWAARQPDQISSLIAKLTERNARSPEADRCAPPSNTRPRQTED